MEDPDQMASLTDPGEVERAEHTRGDRAVINIGNWFAWLFPILMMVIVVQVVLRNTGRLQDTLTGQGWAEAIGLAALSRIGNQAWMDDLQWWLYGIACLVGVAYAVTTNAHVRVDIFYDNYEKAKQRRVDLFALGWLFLPFALVVWDTTLHYAVQSVQSWEGSDSPNGLHNLWSLKVLMNLCFILIAAAALARVRRLLRDHGKLDGWNLFKWTLPSVAFSLNLVVFYAAWWLTRVTNPELAPRRIVRDGLLMNELEYGAYETKLTVIVALVLTAALGAVLYARRAR